MKHVEQWLLTFRNHDLSEILANEGFGLGAAKGYITAQPLLTIQNYFYYIVTFISHHAFTIIYSGKVPQDKYISHEEKIIVWLIGKFFLGFLDILMLYFCVSMLITYSYRNIKREICYSYIALVVLCPTLFVKDYTHLELNSLGYCLLSFVLLVIESGDTLLVTMLSCVLINCHLSYIWMLPPIFIATLVQKRKTIWVQYRENVTKKSLFLLEIFKLVGAFLVTNFCIWLPFIGHEMDVLASLSKILYLEFFDHKVNFSKN